MTALRDLFTLDTSSAEVYVILVRDGLRKAWIQSELKKMGFPGVLSETPSKQAS
jgi:hypothetical protein